MLGELPESWDDPRRDLFIAAGGRYRRRRFGPFAMREGAAQHKAHRSLGEMRNADLV